MKGEEQVEKRQELMAQEEETIGEPLYQSDPNQHNKDLYSTTTKEEDHC